MPVARRFLWFILPFLVFRTLNLFAVISPWPNEGPPLIFVISSLGTGYSSPVVTSDRIYITGGKDSIAWLHAYDLSGKLLWETAYGKEWIHPYPGSRAVPVVADSLVYASSGMGDISCMLASTGRILWTLNIIRSYSGEIPSFGYSLPVAIEGNLLICSPGNEEKNVIALDRFNGRLIWSSPAKGEVAGYACPLIINLGKKKVLVTTSEMNILFLDMSDGKLIWNYELSFKGNQPCNKPMYDGNRLFWVAGSGNGAVCAIPDKDKLTFGISWKNPEFDTYFGDFVSTGSYLFGASEARHKYLLLNSETGRVCDSLSFGTGSVIQAEDKMVAYNQQGRIGLISLQEGKLRLVSSFHLKKGSGEHFSHPVYDKGRLYIRRGEEMMVFDLY